MRRILLAALAAAVLVLVAPGALAGSADAPELTDPSGDCQFAPGNEYADVVSAWISDETAATFDVNLALAKWTLDQAGEWVGFTLQFEHQGKQFGVAAFYAMGAWEFSNGYVDLEEGSTSEFTDAPGSFTPGAPALIKVTFDKSHFPHGDAADNQLRGFHAGTADFKGFAPFWLAGQDAPAQPPFWACDEALSDATYTFTVGGHSSHDMGSGDADAGAGAPASGAAPADEASASDEVEPAAAPPEDANETPGPGLALLAAAVLVSLVARRR